MHVDEVVGHLLRRSSSACAKYALARRRISLARFSSRTSRSSSLIRAVLALLTPSRWPVSRSFCRTQAYSVWAVQPIFAAIDWIAAHCDGCSLRCSNTIRTERSRTSGAYFVVFFMASSSQEWAPPRNPGRFTFGMAACTGVNYKE